MTACANSLCESTMSHGNDGRRNSDVMTSSIKRNAIEAKMQFHAATIRKKAPMGEGRKGNNWFL